MFLSYCTNGYKIDIKLQIQIWQIEYKHYIVKSIKSNF